MTTRPAYTPLFATDPTLDVSAGLDAGLAPRNDPGALVRGQGFHPAKLPCRWLNHELGVHGDWLAYLDEISAQKAMQQWTRETLPAAAFEQYYFLIGVSLGGKAKTAVAIGRDMAGTNTRWTKADRGGFLEATSGTSAINPPGTVCAGPTGAWIQAAPGNGIVQFTGLGAASSTYSLGGFNVAAVGYASGSSTPYLVAQTNGAMLRSASFTAGSVGSMPAGLTAIPAPSLGAPSALFTDDGGNNVVLTCSCTISGVTRLRVLSSTDGGATWTVALTLASGALSLNVSHSTALGFVATYEETAGNLTVATSATGAAWTTISTKTFPSGLATFVGSTAVTGGVIAKVVRISAGGFTHVGLAYTLDLGVTWRYAFLDPANPAPQRVVAINGRFYLITGDQTVYTSGLVETFGADLP
jgi:hypothetical protein